MSSGPSPRAAAEPVPARRRERRARSRARSRERPPVLQYLLGAVIGFFALPALVGALWMIWLFYADWLAGFDTKNDRFSEIVAGSVLVAPFLGVLAGLGFVAWRRRARRRAAASRTGTGRRR